MDQFGSDQHFPELGGQSARGQEQRPKVIELGESWFCLIVTGFIFSQKCCCSEVLQLQMDIQGQAEPNVPRQPYHPDCNFFLEKLLFRIQWALLLVKGIF